MGFLDNLENSLKNLESADERAAASAQDATRRESEQARARATAPFAGQLKTAPFTSELMTEATRIGFELRTKVHLTWLGNTLRLEAKQLRLELRPSPEGIQAVFLTDGEERSSRLLDLNGSALELAREWLAPLRAGSTKGRSPDA